MKKFILLCVMALAMFVAGCDASQGEKGSENVSPSWVDGTYVLSVYVSEDTCTPERAGKLEVLPAFFSRTAYNEETGESQLLFYTSEGKSLQFEGTLHPTDKDGRGVYFSDAGGVSDEIKSLTYNGEFSNFEGDVFHGALLTMQINGGYCATGAAGTRQLLLTGVSYQM